MYLPARRFGNHSPQPLWKFLICLFVTAVATGCDDSPKIVGSVGATTGGSTPAVGAIDRSVAPSLSIDSELEQESSLSGASLDERIETDTRALFKAVENDDARLVTQILNFRGGDLRMRNATGKTALEMALERGNAAIAEMLTIPDALFVPPNAEHVIFGRDEIGCVRVGYFVDESPPATRLLEFVKDRLEAIGWRPVPECYFYPSQPSSHVEGWSRYRANGGKVEEWSAEWQDGQGDVFKYLLRADRHTGSSRAQDPEGTKNRVIGACGYWYPRALARQRLAELQRLNSLPKR